MSRSPKSEGALRPAAGETAGSLPISEGIYQTLRKDIMQCAVRPGAMVDTAAIAREHNVSKTPVRDALQRLAAEGLVIALPRSGYRVAPITMEAVHEILDLRAALGPHAARQAARYATPEEIREIRRIVAEYSRPLDIETMRGLARQFHLAVARCSRNKRLVALSETIFDELERLLRWSIDFTIKAGEHSDEHTALVDAIEAGDGDLAARIEAEHIARSRQFLIEKLIVGGYIVGIYAEADAKGPRVPA